MRPRGLAASLAGLFAEALERGRPLVGPLLESFIDLALANNSDLRVAGPNSEKAAALYRIQRAEMNPTLGVQATGIRARSSTIGSCCFLALA